MVIEGQRERRGDERIGARLRLLRRVRRHRRRGEGDGQRERCPVQMRRAIEQLLTERIAIQFCAVRAGRHDDLIALDGDGGIVRRRAELGLQAIQIGC